MTLLLPFIIVVIFSFRDWAFREPNNSSGDLKVSETVVQVLQIHMLFQIIEIQIHIFFNCYRNLLQCMSMVAPYQ